MNAVAKSMVVKTNVTTLLAHIIVTVKMDTD